MSNHASPTFQAASFQAPHTKRCRRGSRGVQCPRPMHRAAADESPSLRWDRAESDHPGYGINREDGCSAEPACPPRPKPSPLPSFPLPPFPNCAHFSPLHPSRSCLGRLYFEAQSQVMSHHGSQASGIFARNFGARLFLRDNVSPYLCGSLGSSSLQLGEDCQPSTDRTLS